MMDYEHEVGLTKHECCLNCDGFHNYVNNDNLSTITNPQMVYEVQGATDLPHNDDRVPIILDVSNNLKVKSGFHTNHSQNSDVIHPYTCVNCDMRFVQESSLNVHYVYCVKKIEFQVAGNNIYNENKVGSGENNSNILEPLPSLDNNEPIANAANACNVCLKSFKNKDFLKKHVERTSSEGAVKCDMCNRTLHGPAGYMRHLKTHYGKNCEICYECGKKFTTVKALNKHLLSHNKNERNVTMSTQVKPRRFNSCHICERTFSSNEKLEKHLKAREGDVPIKCSLCDRTLHSSGYEYHMKAHSAPKFECSMCSSKFISLQELKEHKRSYHNDEKQFFCEICKKCYKDKTGLKMHLRIHTGETPYSCDICQMKFTFSSTLKYHKKIHSREHSTLCNICNVSFPNLRELTTHNRIHEGEKIFKCCCGKLFRLLTSLIIHQKNSRNKCVESSQVYEKKSFSSIMINSNNIIPKKHLCDKCNRSFHTLKALEKHKRRKIHTINKEDPICKICQKCFQTNNQLKKHEKVHKTEPAHICAKRSKCFPHIDKLNVSSHVSDEKQTGDYLCNVCGNSFGNSITLKRHMKSHAKLRPYVCHQCSAVFADSKALDDHRVVHPNIRYHFCETCGKAFKSFNILKVHSRVHMPDRPYKCTLCSKSFKHLGSLVSHKVTHTGVKTYQCQFCQMKFAHAKGLKRHDKIHTEYHQHSEKPSHESVKHSVYYAGYTSEVPSQPLPVIPLTQYTIQN